MLDYTRVYVSHYSKNRENEIVSTRRKEIIFKDTNLIIHDATLGISTFPQLPVLVFIAITLFRSNAEKRKFMSKRTSLNTKMNTHLDLSWLRSSEGTMKVDSLRSGCEFEYFPISERTKEVERVSLETIILLTLLITRRLLSWFGLNWDTQISRTHTRMAGVNTRIPESHI